MTPEQQALLEEIVPNWQAHEPGTLILSLLDALAEARKDAERYRFWCDNYEKNFGVVMTKEKIDLLTDQAMLSGSSHD